MIIRFPSEKFRTRGTNRWFVSFIHISNHLKIKAILEREIPKDGRQAVMYRKFEHRFLDRIFSVIQTYVCMYVHFTINYSETCLRWIVMVKGIQGYF